MAQLDDLQAFVNIELPRRRPLLTVAITSYDGDPNLGGAPAILQGSPVGTWYLRETPVTMYEKLTPGAATWTEAGAGGGGGGSSTDVTVEPLNIPIDPTASGNVLTTETFQTQAEIDDHLSNAGDSGFRYLEQIWEAIPSFVLHEVTFDCSAAGNYDPQPSPLSGFRAFEFAGKVFIKDGKCIFDGPALADYSVVQSTETVLTSDVSLSSPSVTVSGTPFSVDALKGKLAIFDNGAAAIIRSNTTSQIFLQSVPNPAPTDTVTTFFVGESTSLIRNSDDGTTAKTSNNMLGLINNIASAESLTPVEFNRFKLTGFGASSTIVAGVGGYQFTFLEEDHDSHPLTPNGINLFAGLDTGGNTVLNATNCSFHGTTQAGKDEPLIVSGFGTWAQVGQCYFSTMEDGVEVKNGARALFYNILCEDVASTGNGAFFASRGAIMDCQNFNFFGPVNEALDCVRGLDYRTSAKNDNTASYGLAINGCTGSAFLVDDDVFFDISDSGPAGGITGTNPAATGGGVVFSGQGNTVLGPITVTADDPGVNDVVMSGSEFSYATADLGLNDLKEFNQFANPSASFQFVGTYNFANDVSFDGAGTDSNKIGDGATAAGDDSISYGDGAAATANSSVALGRSAQSLSVGTIALGETAVINTGSDDSIAIGRDVTVGVGSLNCVLIGPDLTVTSGRDNVVMIGDNTAVTGANAVAIGLGASADSSGIAIGEAAIGSAQDGIAIGRSTSAGTRSVSLGVGALAPNTGSIAIGDNADTTGASSSIAIGDAATATGSFCIAIGNAAQSLGTGRSIGFGASVTAQAEQALMFGNEAINNQAPYGMAMGWKASLGTGALAARGWLKLPVEGSLIDGEDIVLDDGTNPAVTFRYDPNVTVVETPTLRSVVPGATGQDNVAAAYRAAINAAPTLDITASSASNLSGGGLGVVLLENDATGTAGNVAITTTIATADFRFVGMADGAASGVGGRNIAIGAGLTAHNQLDNIYLGHLAYSTGSESLILGNTAYGGNNAVAMGHEARAEDLGVAIGNSASMLDAANSIVIGQGAKINAAPATFDNDNCVIIGQGTINQSTTTAAPGVTAIGQGITIGPGSEDATVVGRSISTSGAVRTVVIGTENQGNYSGQESVGLGYNLQNGANRTVSIGESSGALGTESVAIGSAATVASGSQRSLSIGTDSDVTAGNDATVIGVLAQGSADDVIAIGEQASATGISSGAIGKSASATGSSSLAIGASASQSVGFNGTAIGVVAISSANSATAIGTSSTASGAQSTSVGQNSTASSTNSTAIGRSSVAGPGTGAIAIGTSVTANAANALGVGGSVSGQSGTAVGVGASVTGTSGTAVGAGASTTTNIDATAVGQAATATGTGATAIGKGALADQDATLAAGRDALIGDGNAAFGSIITPAGFLIGDGQTFTIDDGVNTATVFEFDDDASVVESTFLRQVPFTGAETADQMRDLMITAIGNAPTLDVTASIGTDKTGQVDLLNDAVGGAGNVGLGETVSSGSFRIYGMSGGGDAGTNATAVGDTSIALSEGTTALGTQAEARGVNSSAFGFNAVASSNAAVSWGAGTANLGEGAVAVGNAQTLTRLARFSVGIGFNNTVNDEASIAIGNLVNVQGRFSFAAIQGASAAGDRAIAIGNGASASVNNGLALGQGADAIGTDGNIALGRESLASDNNSISIGQSSSATGFRAITCGFLSSATASNAIAIGESASSTHANAIALGDTAISTAANRMTVGTVGTPIDLELFGAVRVGDTTDTTNGTIRLNSGNLEGREGGAWVSLTAGATGGDVSKVGTPVNDQIGVWTGDGTIEGDANLVWDGSIGRLTATSLSNNLPAAFVNDGTSTSGVKSVAVIKAKSSGEMVDGFGPSLVFQVEDVGGNNTIANITAERQGNDSTGQVSIEPRLSGVTASNAFVVDSSGAAAIGTNTFTDVLNRLIVKEDNASATRILIENLDAGASAHSALSLSTDNETNPSSMLVGSSGRWEHYNGHDGTGLYRWFTLDTTNKQRMCLLNNGRLLIDESYSLITQQGKLVVKNPDSSTESVATFAQRDNTNDLKVGISLLHASNSTPSGPGSGFGVSLEFVTEQDETSVARKVQGTIHTETISGGTTASNMVFQVRGGDTIGTDAMVIEGGTNNVGVGTSTPDAEAILDLTSTVKGFLPPRLTTGERNALTGVAGLQIYNTTNNEMEYYNGSGWRTMDAGAAT